MSDSVVWIVRHGNTFDTNDTVRRVGGRTDIGLSQSGMEQARKLGAHFSEFMFASAQCGPLKRTCQTAEILLSSVRNPPRLKITEFLREIDYGPDENVPEVDVINRLGREALVNWEKNLIPPEGWKVDRQELTQRWIDLIAELSSITGHHLVVTSNGVARFALQGINAKVDSAKLPTGGFGCIELRHGKVTNVPYWGIRPNPA